VESEDVQYWVADEVKSRVGETPSAISPAIHMLQGGTPSQNPIELEPSSTTDGLFCREVPGA
jgi:hypothetical protein